MRKLNTKLMELEFSLIEKLDELRKNLSPDDVKRISEEKADKLSGKPMPIFTVNKYLKGEGRFEEVTIDILKRGIIILKEKLLKLDSIIKSLENGIEITA